MSAPAEQPPDWVIETHSPDETEDLAEALGRRLSGGEVILLHGELAAGKTCFASGLARGLGVAEPAVSPTYIILRSYPAARGITLHHFDFYRLEGDDQADEIGAPECDSPQSVVLAEWPERCPGVFDGFTLDIRLTETGPESRRLEIRRGPRDFNPQGWPQLQN